MLERRSDRPDVKASNDPRAGTVVDPRLSLALWLRAGRAQRGLTLEDVSRVTKIQTRILERLESGKPDGLPADVFVRGFVRSYAKCVGLDEDEALRRYGACGVASAPAVTARAMVEAMADLAPSAARAIPARAPLASGSLQDLPRADAFADGAAALADMSRPGAAPLILVDSALPATIPAVAAAVGPIPAAAEVAVPIPPVAEVIPAAAEVAAPIPAKAISAATEVLAPTPAKTISAAAEAVAPIPAAPVLPEAFAPAPMDAAAAVNAAEAAPAPAPAKKKRTRKAAASAGAATPTAAPKGRGRRKALATGTPAEASPVVADPAETPASPADSTPATSSEAGAAKPEAQAAEQAASAASVATAIGDAVPAAAELAPVATDAAAPAAETRGEAASAAAETGQPEPTATEIAAGTAASPVATDVATGFADARSASSEAAPAAPVIDIWSASPLDVPLAPPAEAAPEEPASTETWRPKMPPAATQSLPPWRRPRHAATALPAVPSLVIDDADPESAEQLLEERAAAKSVMTSVQRRSFLPPVLLDREDRSARQGGLTLAVIILLIAATLTLSYLMRRPSSSGDGVTQSAAPVQMIG